MSISISKVVRFIYSGQYRFDFFDAKGLLNWMPDGMFLRMKYRRRMGKKLNLRCPETFSEKLQWLKLHDRNPLYARLVDKYEVKQYVSEIIGSQYVIPTLGVWNRFENIDFEKLPDQFVLKCTHDSGGIAICKEKRSFSLDSAKKIIDRRLRKNYYFSGREWPYKNIRPRIIAEQYMEDGTTGELRDYKFFCFDGIVKAMFVATERQKENSDVKFDFFTPAYEQLPFRQGHDHADDPPEKPEKLEEMIQLAEKLSAGIPHVRVDFYETDRKVFFGEFTFFHFSGLVPFEPDEWDRTFGDWLTLPDPARSGGRGTRKWYSRRSRD